MLLAIIALVLLLFGVVGLLTSADLRLVSGHFVVGAALLVYAATTRLGELRDVLRRDASRRSVRLGGNATVQVALVGVIAVFAAILAQRHPVHWDWTEAGEHTLAQASLDLLEAIPDGEGIEIYAFAITGSEADLEERKLLGMYEYASERLSVQHVDPNRRPELAQRFEVHADGVLIVCRGACDTSKATARPGEASEQEVTKAIRSVISEQRLIYLLEGHGEIDPADSTAAGLSRAKLALEDENYRVEALLLASLEGVPEDADAVLVVGPTHSLLQRELEALDRYLRAGGSVGVLADPIVVSNLEAQVADWGIELGADVIVDEQLQLFAGPRLGVQTIVTDYGEHPITDEIQGRPTSFQLARSVRPAQDADSEVVTLASTRPSAWAESDVAEFGKQQAVISFDPEKDLQGPVSLAVARSFAVEGKAASGADSEGASGAGSEAANETDSEGASGAGSEADGREGRLVVFGDADFARNRYIAELYNIDLLLNLAGWLVGEESFITIDRTQPRASTAYLTEGELATFRYLSIFVLPEAIVLLGVITWWRRRS